jgi:hypothetical protein
MLGKIIFASGMGGNHLRWLLFLDDKFTNLIGDQSIGAKLKFIKNNVYTPTRSYYNWLAMEWNYREKLNSIVEVSHQQYNNDPAIKTLYLTVSDSNSILPFYHYFHMNPLLNGNFPALAKKKKLMWCNDMKLVPETTNAKVIDSSCIFDLVLDKKFYTEVIDFFDLDNHYESAQQIHHWYSQCRIKSARDFYEYYSGEEFFKTLEYMRQLGNQQ